MICKIFIPNYEYTGKIGTHLRSNGDLYISKILSNFLTYFEFRDKLFFDDSLREFFTVSLKTFKEFLVHEENSESFDDEYTNTVNRDCTICDFTLKTRLLRLESFCIRTTPQRSSRIIII